MQTQLGFTKARFNGSDYDHSRDSERLGNQLQKIYNLMVDGTFRILAQIEQDTGEPQASISAQMRHLRKPRFGSHTVNKKYLGDGLYIYQLITNKN
jgi:hypothetical protein